VGERATYLLTEPYFKSAQHSTDGVSRGGLVGADEINLIQQVERGARSKRRALTQKDAWRANATTVLAVDAAIAQRITRKLISRPPLGLGDGDPDTAQDNILWYSLHMESAHTPTLYLFCGKIAAGKSTLARHLAARPATLLIGEDHWMSNLFSGDLRTIDDYRRFSARLRAAMGPHIVNILQQGLSIVLDFPANTVSNRNWMRSLITQANAAHELHLIDIPDAICKRRLRERNALGEHPFVVDEAQYDLFTSYFVPPEPSEGFNVFVHTP
jgi:predicted kinase